MEHFINEMVRWPEHKYSLVAQAVESVVFSSHSSFGLWWPQVQILPFHSLSTILPLIASGRSVTLAKVER